MTRRSSTRRTGPLLRRERRLAEEGFTRIAGVDEAGRGPLAGPVVAGAVILRRTAFRNRIDDSKRLSAIQRERAYDEILAGAHVGVGIVDGATIDEVNIHRATHLAMMRALSALPAEPDYVLVDGHLPVPTRCPCEPMRGGDGRSMSIAAASIVAKVTRDRLMLRYDRVYPQYGFSRHKGYPTLAHRRALTRYGPSPIHRKTFHPVSALCFSR